MNDLEKVNVYCNSCMGTTWHTVLFQKTQEYQEEFNDNGFYKYFENHKYSLVECCGCENITLIDESQRPDESDTTYYPPRTFRKEPKWLLTMLINFDIVDNLFKSEFIREIYVALKNNMPRLAVIGIRALLEQIMIEKVGDKGSFYENVKAFEKQGFISKVQREAIEPVLEAGHASVHRGFKASIGQVARLMDVTENIIESIYINEIKVKNVEVPKRNKKSQ